MLPGEGAARGGGGGRGTNNRRMRAGRGSGAPPAPRGWGINRQMLQGEGAAPGGGRGGEAQKIGGCGPGGGFPGSPEQQRRGLGSGRTMRSARRKGIERSGSTSGPRRSAARAPEDRVRCAGGDARSNAAAGWAGRGKTGSANCEPRGGSAAGEAGSPERRRRARSTSRRRRRRRRRSRSLNGRRSSSRDLRAPVGRISFLG